MKNIDFLPAEYRQQTAHRKTRSSRLTVLAVFAGLVGAAAVGQIRTRRGIERDLYIARTQYDAAVAASDRLISLESQLRAQRAAADVWTYLRHPWPRTQILSSIVAELPGSITLDKFEVKHESIASLQPTNPPAPPAAQAAGQDPAVQLPPAERDLARLRGEFDHAPTVVTLEGVTRDSASLHAYLAKLSRAELFASAELRSIKSLTEETTGSFIFTARLIVRPGYGQPKGPVPADLLGVRRQAARSEARRTP